MFYFNKIQKIILFLISIFTLSIFLFYTSVEKKSSIKTIYEIKLPTIDDYTLILSSNIQKIIRSEIESLDLEYYKVKLTYPNKSKQIFDSFVTIEVIDNNISENQVSNKINEIIEKENNRFLDEQNFKRDFSKLIDRLKSYNEKYDVVLQENSQIFETYTIILKKYINKSEFIKEKVFENETLKNILYDSDNLDDFSFSAYKAMLEDEELTTYLDTLYNELYKHNIRFYYRNVSKGYLITSYKEAFDSQRSFILSGLLLFLTFVTLSLYLLITLYKR